ncbi:MAG TPA: P-loop NTPase [Kofleriaceae bacterium]|jgi:flagellar biosynthesis protein FlhG|nr:P-loop NTPase [Kofleriaceae bacterium]
MADQAATLRVLRGGKTGEIAPARRAVAVTGGKGGIGKSTLSVNLAVAYAQAGAKTLLVDTDLGMADLNLLLGVAPEKNVLDALGGAAVADVLVDTHGVKLLPGLNGSNVLANLGVGGLRRILELVESLAPKFDSLVIDVAAGISSAQTMFAGATSSVVVVVNPEPLSIADAYACLKVLATEHAVTHAHIVANRVLSRAHADEVTARLTALVNRFLDLDVTVLPPIPSDPAVAEAAQIGVPLLVHSPDAPAARAIRSVAKALGQLAAPQTWWRERAQGEAR